MLEGKGQLREERLQDVSAAPEAWYCECEAVEEAAAGTLLIHEAKWPARVDVEVVAREQVLQRSGLSRPSKGDLAPRKTV